MGSTLRIVIGATTYTVNAPQYGYTVNVVLPFHFQKVSPKGYRVWDDGTAYGYRECECTFIASTTAAAALIDILRSATKFRGVPGIIRLAAGSGFYPAGPDYGDVGDFGASIIEFSPIESMVSPYKHTTIRVKFVVTSLPTPTTPTPVAQGPLQIGTVTGLRFPNTFGAIDNAYNLSAVTTRTGAVYSIAGRPESDSQHTTLKMICNASKAFQLVHYLTAHIRTGTVSITCANSLLFGPENFAYSVFSCQMIQQEIRISHVSFNRFEFDLNFYLISAS